MRKVSHIVLAALRTLSTPNQPRESSAVRVDRANDKGGMSRFGSKVLGRGVVICPESNHPPRAALNIALYFRISSC